MERHDRQRSHAAHLVRNVRILAALVALGLGAAMLVVSSLSPVLGGSDGYGAPRSNINAFQAAIPAGGPWYTSNHRSTILVKSISGPSTPTSISPPPPVSTTTTTVAAVPPHPAPSCVLGSGLVPTCGVLTGLYSNYPGGVSAREAEIGLHVNLVHVYKVTFSDAFPTAPDLAQLGHDTALFVDWDTYTSGGTVPIRWSQIASGAWNATIDAEAARLKSYGRPIMVALMHEMELVNRNGAFGTPADFTNMWRQVVTRMRADGAANVIWVWDMGGENAANVAPAYYPGNDVVDWVAWDPYNWGNCPRNPSGWRSFSQIVAQDYQYFTTTAPYNAKPLMLAEYGSVEQTNNPIGKKLWLGSVGTQAAAVPNIKALVYFDSTGACNWAVDSTPSALDGFVAMTASGY